MEHVIADQFILPPLSHSKRKSCKPFSKTLQHLPDGWYLDSQISYGFLLGFLGTTGRMQCLINATTCFHLYVYYIM